MKQAVGLFTVSSSQSTLVPLTRLSLTTPVSAVVGTATVISVSVASTSTVRLPPNVTLRTRSRSVPPMTMLEPAAAGFSLYDANAGFTRLKATVTDLPFSILRVASPSVAVSGIVSVISAAVSNSTPAAPGRSIPETRSRSLPLMVRTEPAFTGEGDAERDAGTTVT